MNFFFIRVRNPFHKHRKIRGWANSCSDGKDPMVLFEGSKLNMTQQHIEHSQECEGKSEVMGSLLMFALRGVATDWEKDLYFLPASHKG